MNGLRWSIVLICIFTTSINAISLYNYFNRGAEIREGLVAKDDIFTLNEIEIPIVSGSFHYFRVHPDYWRITLRKMKAAGLNTVTTYMPWNLHNPRIDVYDFGKLGEDMSEFLDLKRFVELAMDEELFVILRPGPFIGGQWEFGGMPSWILRDQSMHVRSLYDGFTTVVSKYYKEIYKEIGNCSYINGGSIIAMQIENEFGYFGYNDFPREISYLEWLKKEMDGIGFQDLLYFTSDKLTDTKEWGSCPGVLQAVNIQTDADQSIAVLEDLQPNSPHMVMEFATGTYDHWLNSQHNQMIADDITKFIENLMIILEDKASFNMYMFVGGTNFGFMAGGNFVEDLSGNEEPVDISYYPITTSYDYDAPISENGDYYSDKYNKIMASLQQMYPLWNEIDTPDIPTKRLKGKIINLIVAGQIGLHDLCDKVENKIYLTNGTINMEALDININQNGVFSGQSYGYVLYEANVKLKRLQNVIQIKGHVRDMAQLIVGNYTKTNMLTNYNMANEFGFWNGRDKTLEFDHIFQTEDEETKIKILVENLGRVSFGKPHYFDQRKGLYEGPVLINNVAQLEWTAFPLEFKKDFVKNLMDWDDYTGDLKMPAAYLFEYRMEGNPKDIYIDTSDWQKGVIFVNGFNLGRYWTAETPVKTMYLPAPILEAEAINEIIVFEQYTPSATLKIVIEPDYVVVP